jgi:hypothetical protein
MVARTAGALPSSRPVSHLRGWLIGAILGLAVGVLTGFLPGLGLAVGAAAILVMLAIGPRRAAIGGLLVGAGLTISYLIGPRIGSCTDIELEALRACTVAAFGWLFEVGHAIVVLGLALTIIALRRRGGDGRPSAGRVLGAAIAVAITSVAAVLEILSVHHTSGTFDPITIGLGTGWGAPTIAAGMLTGWICGPAARRAAGPVDWILLVVGMGFLAVVLGSFAVGAVVGIERLATDAVTPFTLGAWIPMGLILAIIGVLLVGPYVLPLAFGASVLWAMGMARMRDRAPFRGTRS